MTKPLASKVSSPTYFRLPILINGKEMVQADWSDESRAGHIVGLNYWLGIDWFESLSEVTP